MALSSGLVSRYPGTDREKKREGESVREARSDNVRLGECVCVPLNVVCVDLLVGGTHDNLFYDKGFVCSVL